MGLKILPHPKKVKTAMEYRDIVAKTVIGYSLTLLNIKNGKRDENAHPTRIMT